MKVIERKVSFGFLIALAFLGVIGVVCYLSVVRLTETSRLVAHSQLVISNIDALVSTTFETESAQRGYLITGEEPFAAQYTRAAGRVEGLVQQLRDAVQTDPAQSARVEPLAEAVRARLNRSNLILDIRRRDGFDAVQRFLAQSTGRPGVALQAQVSALGQAIKAEEIKLLNERERDAQRSATFARMVIIGGSTLALLFVGFALFAFHRDFAGRARAEADLNRFFDLSIDLYVIASGDGYFKRMSPAILDLLGYTIEEGLKIPYMEMIHPDDRPEAMSTVERQMLKGERINNYTGRFRHKDGSYRVLSWRSMPRGDLMFASARDVTDSVRAEHELREAKEQLEARVAERTHRLQEQLARLALLSRITRAIGERQDLRSIFQVVVARLEEEMPVDFGCIFLYDHSENRLTVTCVGGRSVDFATALGLADGTVVPIDENGLARCVRGEMVYEPEIAETPFPFPQRLARAGLGAMVIAPLLVESQVFGVLVCARKAVRSFSSGECEFLKQASEHTALAANQAQLNGALQQAYDDLRQTQQQFMQQERLRALGQMASGIAHDINNAISPVALYTEALIEREPNLTDRARNYLEIIQRAVDDVAQTVARMGEFYRMREPQVALVPVDINTLVKQVVDLTRARWSDMSQQRGVSIEMQLELANDLPPIAAVDSQLRDALVNLVFNALDAMPQGGPLKLRTAAMGGGRGQPQSVVLEVTDSGIGMDEETRRRCLEPFFTTKGARGTGLGLAMVYGVAQRHGATLEIESEPGKGTTMRLVFADAPAEPVAASGSQKPPAGPTRVLVVDDDPLLLKSLRDTLESDGHLVTTANGGQAGINAFVEAHAAGAPFPVVITDLGMPHVDGRKVASTVKSSVPDTLVVMLTGWGRRLVAEGDVPPGVDLVLSKPPKLADLRQALTKKK